MKTTESQKVAESLLQFPAVSVELATKLAKQYYGRYAQRRGSMVVDVVSSAWRNYDRVEKTAAWKKFAGPYSRFLDRRARPADIYGPNGALDGWGMTFKHPSELWEVLARNMGGGMPPAVPKALVELCGPRVESLPKRKRVTRGAR
jgi:hypothetical protein